jgi:uncharacterized ferritin-like protein (DUF455 family)
MDFYNRLEKALTSDNINIKELIVDELIEFCQTQEPQPPSNFKPKIFKEPSYSKICKVVKPYQVKSRKGLDKIEGIEALLHSIAHIEWSAIDLAIDAVYRFYYMPNEFKLDWLNVAKDEIRHFKMLNELLNRADSYYGALPVHKALFDMANRTAHSPLERMATIPRYQEASGLDANSIIINKLKTIKARSSIEFMDDIIEALNVIYIEEIDHVKAGDKWFKYLCQEMGLNPTKSYIDIIKSYNLMPKSKKFDIEARKKAGFSCDELIQLGARECS